MSRLSGCILALVFAATLVAAITAYATGSVTAYVVQPFAIGPRPIVVKAEPQIANRLAKADRVALLRDTPSYANFSPSLLQVAISLAAANFGRRSDLLRPSSGLLNDAQIAGIETRLRLTPQQAEHWPAIASALRDIGRRYFPVGPNRRNGAEKIGMTSIEVRRLVETAMPLIPLLRDDQKREVRKLVRILGLEAVAAQI